MALLYYNMFKFILYTYLSVCENGVKIFFSFALCFLENYSSTWLVCLYPYRENNISKIILQCPEKYNIFNRNTLCMCIAYSILRFSTHYFPGLTFSILLMKSRCIVVNRLVRIFHRKDKRSRWENSIKHRHGITSE
jgi:hypothetical protein